jgi:hypothetical protein
MTWAVKDPAPGCAPPANPAACPASFTSLHPASACPAPNGDLACDYAEGRCACIACTNAGAASSEWGCRQWVDVAAIGPYAPDASASCPADLPELGAPCDYPDQTICMYDPCGGVNLGHSVACADGYWQPALLTASCAIHACG